MNTAQKPHMIFQGDKPCSLVSFTGKRRDLVLYPGNGDVALFRSRAAAKGAVTRTKRIAERLRGSLISDWDKLAPLVQGEPHRLVPMERI